MAVGGLVWLKPPSALGAEAVRYGERVRQAVLLVAQLIADTAESRAKAEAPWTDRTGHARGGLTGYAEAAARDLVSVYLYHKAEYGVFLELARGGPYRIILPTLEGLYGEVMAKLRAVLR